MGDNIGRGVATVGRTGDPSCLPPYSCPDNQGYFYGNWETDVPEPTRSMTPGTGKYLGSTGCTATRGNQCQISVSSRRGNWEVTPCLDHIRSQKPIIVSPRCLERFTQVYLFKLEPHWGKAGSLPTCNSAATGKTSTGA